MVVKTKATLVEKNQLSNDVYHFIFSTQDEFLYEAGQFLNFVVEKENQERPLRRAYSITSTPSSSEIKFFELCVKIEEYGEFTPILQQSELGTQFNIMGPLGLFKLKNVDDSSNITQVFIAAGTGIAPMRSFIKDLLLNKNYLGKIVLLFGVRTYQDILYDEEFKELSKKYPNFNYVITLSRADDSWAGLRGYVQDHIDDLEINFVDSTFYICGRTKMVDSVHEVLDSLNVVKERRSHEKFG
ncbi:MAG: FAD-dependent oxidoreductase [Nanoarchaeota archaeon]|nr:FAD-dependent oxidoreductase [Nanoarchaeota archaeon]